MHTPPPISPQIQSAPGTHDQLVKCPGYTSGEMLMFVFDQYIIANKVLFNWVSEVIRQLYFGFGFGFFFG